MIRPKKITIVFVLVAVAALFATAIVYAASAYRTNDEKDITSMWSEYKAAEKADKPKTALAVLDKIKEYAMQNRLGWDYYDACRKYQQMTTRVDWKKNDESIEKMVHDIEQFNDPTVTGYLYLNAPYRYSKSLDEIYDYLIENKAKLLASASKDFWKNYQDYHSSKISNLVKNGFFKDDYHTLLWKLAERGHIKSRIALKEDYEGMYPQGAWLEYYSIVSNNFDDKKKNESLEEFKVKYASNAVSLFAEEDLLQAKFWDMKNDEEKTSSEKFKSLRQECDRFYGKRRSFSGSEKNLAECCVQVIDIIDALDEKFVSLTIKDNVLSAHFKNLTSVDVTLSLKDSKKTVWNMTVKNPVKSYYRTDTVKVDLPDLNDGEYILKYKASGIQPAEIEYQRFSISVATRVNDGVYEIYAADSKTGRPLDEVSGIKLDGFTPLGDGVQSRLKKSYKEEFVCKAESPTGKVLLSRPITNSDFRIETIRNGSTANVGRILTDCGVYKPGDAVRFKVIAFSTYSKEGEVPVRNVLASRKISVKLLDPERKTVGQITGETNGFGAISSEFVLPKDSRNGYFQIVAEYDGMVIAREDFTVGEYALPSFEVKMNSFEGTVFSGETVTFSGYVKSYSGKTISLDKSTFEITNSWKDKEIKSGNLTLDPDGSFSVSFVASEEGYYVFKATVVDATGESQRVNSSIAVQDNVYFDINIKNTIEADASSSIFPDDDNFYLRRPYRIELVIGEDFLKTVFNYRNHSGVPSDAVINYEVKKDGVKLTSGTCSSNREVTIQLDGEDSGRYTIEAKATVTSKEGKSVVSDLCSEEFIKVKPEASILNVPLDNIVIPSSEGVGFTLGSSTGDIWAVVTVVSSNGKILKNDAVHIDGKRGEKGSLLKVSYIPELSWSETVQVYLHWFRNHTSRTWSHTFNLPSAEENIGIEFTSFTDSTAPSKKTDFTLKVPTNTEVAVSVYDKSTETISRLSWDTINPPRARVIPIIVNTTCGTNRSSFPVKLLRSSNRMMTKAAGSYAVLSDQLDLVEESAPVMSAMSVNARAELGYMAESTEEEAIPFVLSDDIVDEPIRDTFEEVISFIPFLYPDEDGNVSFSVTPSGKLSTYIVKAYVHNKNMNTNQVQREFVVSIPVELSIAEPQFLYVGDKYVLNASVSANKDVKLSSGTMKLSLIDGKDKSSKPIMTLSKNVNFDKNGLASASFEIPSVPSCGTGELGLMVTFSGRSDSGDKISDGAIVSVPVFKTEKMMTESHSAVYKAGMDKAAVVSILSSQFTNLSSKNAALSERKISDMIAEVLSENEDPKSDDAISIMEAIEVRMLSSKLSGKNADCSSLVKKLLECRNSDGGFAWRKDMESSQMVTLFVLQAAAILRDKGIVIDQLFDLSSSVKYIDRERTSKSYYWYGSSLSQYCYIRSLYCDVKYTEKPSKEFKKEIKEYLNPKDESEFSGNILAKVRRTLTIDALSVSDNGIALASEWGVTISTSRRLSSTRKMDIESVKEYAVDHPSGGRYFPNAVMPFRGLLESEIYAHTLLCEMFKNDDPALSDDLRLWLMIQKETQEWKTDPTTVLAIAAIMEGSKELMETSVITLTSTGEQQFKDTKATSNGFTVKTQYYRKNGNKWVEVKEGETLHIGDKLKAVHKVYSDENRSFVKMVTSRPACLKPDSPISGRYGWRLYRDVRLNSTEWWWDAFSEENTSYEEYFTVSQEGLFQSFASEIECLYSPVWRANDNAHPAMRTAF